MDPRTKVRFICILLTIIELGLLVHNSILVYENNGEFLNLTGKKLQFLFIFFLTLKKSINTSPPLFWGLPMELCIIGKTLDNYYIQMAVIIGTYSIGIFTNLVLLWSSGTLNQWLVLPWLLYYMLIIFACLCSGNFLAI